jgi:ferredoxin
MEQLKRQYDAVLLATGTQEDGKIQVDRLSYMTSEKGVFAAGGCIGSRNLHIRAVADGKEAADSIQSFLLDGKVHPKFAYNHRMGRLEPEEMDVFKNQASRCLHCDCRKADNCRLRDLATDLGARQRNWQGEKKLFRQVTEHEQIVFEPRKCIQCGLCIQVAQSENEKIGLSYQGRGFEEEITVPLNQSFANGLTKAAEKCTKICPTGALAAKQS